MQFQKARGAANGHRFEPGALDQNSFGGKGDFGFRAAHDSTDADGAGAVAIRDHANVQIELAFYAIQSPHFFCGLRAPTNTFLIADFAAVESITRMAEPTH